MTESLLDFCSAILVTIAVSSTNPVLAILGLVGTFIISSIFLYWINVEFLALVYLIVYLGAIAILFLFVSMMLEIKNDTLQFKFDTSFETYLGFITLSSIIAIITEFIIALYDVTKSLTDSISFEMMETQISIKLIKDEIIVPVTMPWNEPIIMLENMIDKSMVISLGSVLYDEFSSHFLICGILLTIAMIVAVSITIYRISTVEIRHQQIVQQITRISQETLFKT